MTRHREELDDLVDRVASAMTFAPPDPARARQLLDRLGHTQRLQFAPRPLVFAAAALTVLIAVLTFTARDPEERLVSPLKATADPAAPPAAASSTLTVPDPPPDAEPSRVVRRARATARAEALAPMPQIAALEVPSRLELAELPSESLSIAPVDVVPLELTMLDVTGVAGRDEKE